MIYGDQTKQCGACKETKPLAEFHADKSKLSGRASSCKACALERASKWYEANWSRARRAQKAGYEANRDARLAADRAYRAANAERCKLRWVRWHKANPETKRKSDLNWQKSNPEKVKAYHVVSAAKRRARTGDKPVPAALIAKLGDAQRWKCGVCRSGIRSGFHLDHIQPLARGGEHVPRNLQLLCPRCNGRKSSKDPIDFMRECGRLL